MKKIYHLFFFFCLLLLCQPRNITAQSPRLFLDSTTIDSLNKWRQIPGSHHHLLYKQIRERVNSADYTFYGSFNSNYSRSFKAVESAFLYVLTDSAKYADTAYQVLEAMYTSGDEGTPTIPDVGDWDTKTAGSKALTYAFPSMAYGICYDWARKDWKNNQKQYVLDSIRSGLDDWEALFRWELYNMPTSNWVSVCRGAEIVMMLGGGEETNRATRYEGIKDSIRHHYRISYGPTGFSYEGLGYIHYGVPFGMAAMYAAQDIGDTTLNILFDNKYFPGLMMHAFSYTSDRLHIMTGADANSQFGEGLFGLLFGNISGDTLRMYKSFYDNHFGLKSGLPENEQFDQKRLGAVWNMIFYPPNIQATNPAQTNNGFLSDHQFGAYLMRNNWQDSSDILIDFIGKFERHESNSWKVAETFNFSITGHNNMYIGQSAKTYEHSNFSSLLVDTMAFGDHNKPHSDTGYLVHYEEGEDYNYIIINGGQKYDMLDVDHSERHFYTKFYGDSLVLISMLDIVKSNSPHYYRWQINTGDAKGDAGISTNIAEDNQRSAFLLQGKNQGYIKGWCMNHENYSFQGHDPLYLETPPNYLDTLWVVLLVGQGNEPEKDISGDKMNSLLSHDLDYAGYDHENNRLFIDPIVPSSTTFTQAEQSNDMKVYPNPASETLYLQTKLTGPVNISIISINGQLIKQVNLETSRKDKIILDISNLHPGLYVIRAENKNQIKRTKLQIH